MKKTPAARTSARPTSQPSPRATLEEYSTWLGSKVHRLGLACLYGRLQAMPPWEELELLRQFTTRRIANPHFDRDFVEFIARPERRAEILKRYGATTPHAKGLIRGAKREQERRNREYSHIQMLANTPSDSLREAFLDKAEALVNGIIEARKPEVDHLLPEELQRFRFAMAGLRIKEPSPDLWNGKKVQKEASQ